MWAEGASAPLQPEMMLERAKKLVKAQLKHISEARELSIELEDKEFSAELVKKLQDHAEDVQKTYKTLSKLVKEEKNEETDYVEILGRIEQLNKVCAEHSKAAKALIASAAPKKPKGKRAPSKRPDMTEEEDVD